VEQGKIMIHAVTTQNQIADLLTKPLAKREFTAIKSRIMGERCNSDNPHLPSSVGIHEEHGRTYGTNDKNWSIATPDKTKQSQIEPKTTAPRKTQCQVNALQMENTRKGHRNY